MILHRNVFVIVHFGNLAFAVVISDSYWIHNLQVGAMAIVKSDDCEIMLDNA